jgi:hypothetical protein
MNRKQRRATASKGRKSGALQAAGGQVTTALEALQKIQGLEGSVNMLDGLGGKIDEARQVMDAVGEDVQKLTIELQIQREVNLRLLSCIYANNELPEVQALEQLRVLEGQVRETLVEESIKAIEASCEKG